MGYFSGSSIRKHWNWIFSFGVILPQDSRPHRGMAALRKDIAPARSPKTLILLHGLSDNYLAWFSRTSILRYAEEYDVAVLMPEAARSFYTDMMYGRNYFKFITDELPEYASGIFNISVAPEDLMVAGLSMGGYGALKCGLTYPDRYSGIGVFSPAWDIKKMVFNSNMGTDSFNSGEIQKDKMAIFGNAADIPDETNIFRLFEKAGSRHHREKYFQVCGTEDFLYDESRRLRKMFTESGLDYVYSEMPGTHEWAVWDRAILLLLDYFVRGNRPKEKYGNVFDVEK